MGRGRRHANRLLSAAFDAGIRHFDVAPLYGRGDAEAMLGELARTCRHDITITTKFGLSAPQSTALKRVFISTARGVVGLFPRLQAALPHAGNGTAPWAVDRGERFSPQQVRCSLENSLRTLNTDYIDIFLLHEYELSHFPSDSLLVFLDSAVTSGKILRFGVGSSFSRISKVIKARPELCGVLQFDSSALVPNVKALTQTNSLVMTHSALSDSYRTVVRFIEKEPLAAISFSEEANVNIRDPAVLARLMLSCALEANPNGAVIFSSREPARIASNASAADRPFSSDQIERFDQFLARACLRSMG